MNVATEQMKTDFVGVPGSVHDNRPNSATDVRVVPEIAAEHGAAFDVVRPFLEAPQETESLGRLGHYEILEVLGQGGFGIVVKAFDVVLQRHVAIKILSPMLAGTALPRTYFLREARAAAKVQHENVVRIYAVEESPLPVIVMEYIAGPTLQRRIDAGPIPPAEVVRLGRQMALGLAAAHAQGLVHRDIKPSNILLEGDCAKITDFGIARTADDAGTTLSGMVVGTPMYMSPEQAAGETVDSRSDLFSLGSVLYTMACGRSPFLAGSGLSVLHRVATESPRPISRINAGVPDGLCRVIQRLMSRKPSDRFESAAEVADALATSLSGTARRTSPWRPALALAACVALVVAASFTLRQRQRGNDAPPVAPPDAKIQDRDAWRQQLAGKPGPEQFRLFLQRLQQCNPKIDPAKVVVHYENDDIIHLALHEGAYPDLSPVAGLVKLRSLWMDDGSGVASLEPLRGLPLKVLRCPNNDVTDLSPLEGARLEILGIWGWKGDGDLSVLRGMPLVDVNVGHSNVWDISVFRGMPLKMVAVNETRVKDLSPLAGMPLVDLLADNTLVEDISLVKGMPLGYLAIRATPIKDTTPLRGLSLRALNIDYDPARDAETLASLQTLELINNIPAAQFRATLPPLPKKQVDRADWRKRLASVPRDEKGRLLVERLGVKPAQIEIDFDGDDIVRVDLTVPSADLDAFAGLSKLRSLGLPGSQLTSFEPLRGLPLESLRVNHCKVDDLAPLNGMALKRLEIWGWRGTDLSPLEGMPLEYLNCGDSALSELGPLRNMPLGYLCLNMTRVRDLSPLAGMPINELLIEKTLVDDVSVLRDMPLTLLTIRGTRVTDVRPLLGRPLRHLYIDYNPQRHPVLIASLPLLELINEGPRDQILAKMERDPGRQRLAAVSGDEKVRLFRERLKEFNPQVNLEKVSVELKGDEIAHVAVLEKCPDLTPLAALPHLRSLWMETGDGVKTFEALRGLPLESLRCNNSQVRDLSPLTGMPLKSLHIWAWRGADLGPLGDMKLESLNSGGSGVTDLTPLRAMPLKYLCLNQCKVADISPLAGTQPDHVLLEGTLVKDISPLAGMRLKTLTINSTRVTDAEPIRGMPLTHLQIDYDAGRHADLIASLASLEHLNKTPVKEFLEKNR